jgi:hypothetical protein
MNKSTAANSSSTKKAMFLLCLIVFVLSSCAFALIMKLDRKIEKTSGKVIDSYQKKTFASRKQSYNQEYLVVRYEVNGKEYTGKAVRRTSGDFVPVYYYHGFPGMGWFYKKGNPNLAYCCIFMTLSLLGVILARPQLKKPNAAPPQTQAKQKKK